jgi:hypothetical protein
VTRRLVATLLFGLTLAAGVALGSIGRQHLVGQASPPSDVDIPTIPPTAAFVVPVNAADMTLSERNLFPAPQSLLVLADTLALEQAQRQRLHQLQHDLDAELTALGRRVIVEERRLDRAFAENNIEATRIDALTQKIGSLQGRIRAIRLRAHLVARDTLTPDQLLLFASMRGIDPAPLSERGDDIYR